MEMQNDRGRGMREVDAGMDVVAGHRGPARALERLAVLIDDDQTARGHLLEVGSLGIYQEASPREHHREMIADTLVHIEPRRAAEGGGKIDPRLNRLGLIGAVCRSWLVHARVSSPNRVGEFSLQKTIPVENALAKR